MTTLDAKALGIALSALDRVAPRAAGRIAYRLFCKPPRPRRTAAEARALETLSANLKTAEAHRIAGPDGDIQAYRWRAPTLPAAGTVLLIHGWTAEARIMTLFVEPLRRAGFDVVALDLPAHGLSSGRLLNMPIGARAVLAVADALGPFSGVIAHSFGGLVAALAAEGGAPLTRSLPVDRLVLIATPHAVDRLVRDFGSGLSFSGRLTQRLAEEVTAAAGRPVAAISAGDLLKVAGRPALIVQDDDDDIVPPSDGPLIASASGATLQATKGLGHRRIIIMPVVVKAAVRFLKEAS
jgi:pimeloyl-ACP methyl ester carboxylesterase